MRPLLLLLAAGCGGAAAMPQPTANQAADATDARVYGWDGMELVGLYCTGGAGLAAQAACRWPATLTLPTEPPTVLRRRAYRRELMSGDLLEVHAYGKASGARPPVLVVESAAGVSLWVAALDEQLVPGEPPQRVADGSGVPSLPVRVVARDDRQPVIADLVVSLPGGGEGTVQTTSHVMPVALAALDLDGDGDPEVIHIGTDDGGGFAGVVEVGGGLDVWSGG